MPAAVATDVLLRARDVRKAFGATEALAGVDFDLRRGEVHALLGPNGAGKSTLVKILSGAYRPDGGTLALEDGELERLTPAAARAAGIETMHQNTALVPQLSVAENVVLGRHAARGGLVDWRGVRARAAAALATIDLELPLHVPVGELSIADRRAVELARALSRNCRVLILDEPTATLGAREAARLIELVRRTAASGVGVLYVSHYLDEVLEVADRATVVRDGRVVAVRELRGTGVTTRDLARDMVGRDVVTAAPAPTRRGEVALRLTEVRVPRRLDGVSLTVHRGEVVGLFGAVGAGQSEIARLVAGQARPRVGALELDGVAVRLRGPREALRRGVALVPEDRLGAGLVPDFDVAETIDLTTRALRRPFLARRRPGVAREWIARLGIHPPDPHARVGTLSGGNQQKVVFAKSMAGGGHVLVLEEPTAGVDVGAKEDLRGLVGGLAAGGAAVVVVSSDPEEVLGLCHRIVVLRTGRVVADMARDGTTRHDLVELATGARDGGD